MYWYRSKTKFTPVLLFAIAWFSACKPQIKETGAKLKFFDLKAFFSADTARLNKLGKPVLKTVTHNGATETKAVPIDNWGQELELFMASDINKPAWRDSYTITNSGGFLIYKAKFPDLKTRELLIKKEGEKVKYILIFNRINTSLYQTSEKLSYFPDSLYIIEKSQKIRLMGFNRYKITGLIDPKQ